MSAWDGLPHAPGGCTLPRVATCLFAWNPALWPWPELGQDRARLARAGHVDVEWSSGRARRIEPGSRAFLVRLGVPPKGIFGAGFVLTAPVAGPHWLEEKAAAGITTHFVQLRLEALFDVALVTFEDLAHPPFSRYRWAVRQSGTRVPSSLAERLEALWEQRLADASPKGPRRPR
jgi:5-methylcytosine-specific restriction protein A